MLTALQQPCKCLFPLQCTSGESKGVTLSLRSIRDDDEPERDFKTNRDSLHDADYLTPADLMTFVWQIAKGMVLAGLRL